MLSTGTRIGSTRILSWLGEGSTGQSYHCEVTEGDFKGDSLFVKLIPREVSEMNGFEDHFQQECQMLEQLEGPGIWPVKAFGIFDPSTAMNSLKRCWPDAEALLRFGS